MRARGRKFSSLLGYGIICSALGFKASFSESQDTGVNMLESNTIAAATGAWGVGEEIHTADPHLDGTATGTVRAF